MSKSVLLSVIIPCYNNIDYVHECLNSIPKLPNSLIEIIIINDGSTDGSDIEINRYISSHKSANIILINQSNQGVSVARNVGLKHSNGMYVTFLDADDLWSPSLWKIIEPVLINNQPDMVIYNASRFYNDNINENSMLEVTKLKDGYHKINNISDLSGVFEANGWFAWCRVYKKELFNGIEFPINREYEDLSIIPVVTAKVKSIYSISDSLVLYRSRHNSITSSPKQKHIDDVMYSMECLYNIFYYSDRSNSSVEVLAKTMQHEYSLLRSINKKVNGYCYFDKMQRENIKKILKPFQSKFKLSLKLKAKFIYLYSKIEQIKNR